MAFGTFLNPDEKEKNRVVFNEITKDAVRMLSKPRQMYGLVDVTSSSCFRPLVGYSISLFYGKKSRKVCQLVEFSLLLSS